MTEVDLIPMQAYQCPNCGQLLKESDYAEGKIDHCVYCDVIFANGTMPRLVVSHLQPVYSTSETSGVRMERRDRGTRSLSIDQLNASSVQNLIARNVESIGLDFELDYLGDSEFNKWKLGFKRGFDRPQIIENFHNHCLDILLGAMIAKKQFGMNFEGSDPWAGRFGYSLILPNHFNRTHWNVEPQQNYHISIECLDRMVMVITGFMDASSKGQIQSVRSVIDGKWKSWMPTQPNFYSGEIVDIDDAYILNNKTTYQLEYNPRKESMSCQLQPIGVVYAPAEQMINLMSENKKICRDMRIMVPPDVVQRMEKEYIPRTGMPKPFSS